MNSLCASSARIFQRKGAEAQSREVGKDERRSKHYRTNSSSVFYEHCVGTGRGGVRFVVVARRVVGGRCGVAGSESVGGEGATLRTAGQAVHFLFAGGRAESHRSVRSETETGRNARSTAAGFADGKSTVRVFEERDGRAARLPARVHETRRVRHGAVRLPAASGDVCRRHRSGAIDAHGFV